MDSPKKIRSKRCNVFLYFTTFTANLSSLSLGATYAWTSPAIPRLNGQISGDNPLNREITATEEAWLVSFLPFGAVLSVLICGYLCDKIGRKNTLLISSIPTFLGYLSLTLGKDLIYFYLGRFLCGLGIGAVCTTIPIYIGEISEYTNRGVLGCFYTFFLAIGTLYVYITAPYMTLMMISAMNLIVPCLFAILFGIFAPESPYFYIQKDRIDLAERSLLKLRYNDLEMVKQELPLMVKSVKESFREKIKFRDAIRDKVVTKALMISLGLIFFQQWSGTNAIFGYLQSIFEEIETEIPSDFSVFTAGIMQLSACVAIMPIVDRFGRRILLLTSCVGNASSLFVAGVYFFLREHTEVSTDNLGWLPIVAINLFVMTYTLGIGPVTFGMIGELFPPNVKSAAATVNIIAYFIFVFSVSNIFPYLRTSVGIGLSFWLYGIICCASVIFVYLKVPETRGKRLEEIQDILSK